MKDLIIYADFNNYKTEQEVICFIMEWKHNLVKQEFCMNDIKKIIYNNPWFKKSFLNKAMFNKIKGDLL